MSTRLCHISMLFLFVAGVSGTRMAACTQPPGFGFIIQSVFVDETHIFPITSNQAFQELGGTFLANNSFSSAGDALPFDGTTDGAGLLPELGKRSPATWQVSFITGRCSPLDPIVIGPTSVTASFASSSTPQQINCVHFATTFSADPSTVYLGSEATVTMTGPNSYYPSTFLVYDSYGNILSTGTPNVVDSTTCTCTFWPAFDAVGNGTGNEYLLLEDAAGNGIGYAPITVTPS